MAPDDDTAALPTETLPCAGLTVVDMTGPYGAYGGRLLADLGADVIRIVPPDGDLLGRHPPLIVGPDGRQKSAFAWFVNLNKRERIIDVETAAGRAELAELLDDADVLLESWTAEDAAAGELEALTAQRPDLVRVSITPFGSDGPWSRKPAVDLTTLAAGGLLSLGGYPDGEPVAAYGDQSLLAASIFGAVAALVGLLARQRDGQGRHMDVSAQEAVAAALEDAIPQFDLTGRVRRRAGGDPREAGTGILACKDGYVSVVAGRLGTAKAWIALTAWLVEAGVPGAEELTGEAWTSFPFRQRPTSIARFQEIFERFAADYTKDELYIEAQRRSIALAPVSTIADVLEDPQLEARDFFRLVEETGLGRPVIVPGRPYRLAGSSGPTPIPMQGERVAAVGEGAA
jgi:benzylsuccinate CoA-transferase BbsE subunit